MCGQKSEQVMIIYSLLFVLLIIPLHVFSGEGSSAYLKEKRVLLQAPLLQFPFDGLTSLDTNLSLSWYESEGAKSYELQISTDRSFVDSSISYPLMQNDSCFISSLKTNSVYFWRVRAKSETTVSDWSDVWKFRTFSRFPEAPYILYPKDRSADIPVNKSAVWDLVSDADLYEIQISRDSTFLSVDIASDNISCITSGLFSFGKLLEKTHYFMRVRGIKGSIKGQWSVISFTTGMIVKNVPFLYKPADSSKILSNELAFNWQKINEAESYDFQISKYEDFRSLTISYINYADTLTNLIWLEPANYFWRVRAKTSCSIGDWSKVFSFRAYMILPSPELTSPANNSEGSVENFVFRWKEIKYLAYYEIQFSEMPAFDSIFFDTITVEAYCRVKSKNYNYQTKYYWRVRGIIGEDTGPWSAVCSFTTIGKMPGVINLLKPNSAEMHYANVKTPNYIFNWMKDTCSDEYMIQFAKDNEFISIVYQKSKIKDTAVFIYDINSDFNYWRVRGENRWGAGPWGEAKLFNLTLPVKKEIEVPAEFCLFQNYPNPFNPSTKIKYFIPARVHVILTVFDVSGRVVKILCDEIQESGYHEINWEPDDRISGGIYFYKLQAEKNLDIRKLVYLK